MSAESTHDPENAKAILDGTYWKLAYGHYTKEGGSQHCGQIVYGKAPLDRFCEKCGTCSGVWRIGRVKWSRYQHTYASPWFSTVAKHNHRIGEFENKSGGWD